MALSFAGGVNPNGVEIAAAAALWVTLMGWLVFPVRVGGVGAGVLSLVAALALVGLRQLSAEKGLIWEGRYLLPLTVGIPIVAGLLLARLPDWDRIAGSAMICTALGILGIGGIASAGTGS